MIFSISSRKRKKIDTKFTIFLCLQSKFKKNGVNCAAKKNIQYLLLPDGYPDKGLSFYIKPHPTVVLYADFKTSAFYANEEKYKELGGIVVYYNQKNVKEEQLVAFKIKNKSKLPFLKNKHYFETFVYFNCGNSVI